ncbi:carbohydrate binding domain-containing protein [Caldicellulosiruptoraceae bacterium PP1]
MKNFRRFLCLFVIFSFILSIIPMSTFAQVNESLPFKDLNDHWAKDTIKKFSEASIINGYKDNTFRPDREITIAEVCSIVNRIFNYQRKTDVTNNLTKPSDWFYQDLQKAYAAKYLPNIDIKNYNTPATRELSFYILNKVFKLDQTEIDKKVLTFTDSDKISNYSKDATINLFSLGAIKGYKDNTIKPLKSITRAEFITILSRLISVLANSDTQYQFNDIFNNVIINSPDTNLKDIEIKGNIYITEGVKDGEVTLQNVKVNGYLFVEGGGPNSIKIVDSSINKVVVDNKISEVKLLASGKTDIKEAKIYSNTNIVEENINGKGFTNIYLNAQDKGINVELNASIDNLILNKGINNLNISNSQIKNMLISEDLGQAKIKVTNLVIDNLEIKTKVIVETDEKTTIKKVTISNTANMAKIIGKANIEQFINNSETAYINGIEVKKDQIMTKEQIDKIVQEELEKNNSQTQGTSSTTTTVSNNTNSTGNQNTNTGNQTGENNTNQDQWKLIFSDDFNGTSLDRTKWNVIDAGGGFGNNELQYYADRPENVKVENGNLVITALKEDTKYKGTNDYTSGKLTTQDKFYFTYGKVEVKAKLPKTKGLWPAIWMMPQDMSLYGGWPRCGEIDIMELLGHEPNKVYGTIHYGNPHSQRGNSYTLENGDFSEDYHIFSLEWEPGEIRWYIDGHLYSTQKNWFSRDENEAFDTTYPAPFNRDFYLILNVAVGGNWPGNPDNTTVFPQQMLVDYVKVYQKSSYNIIVSTPTPSTTLPADAKKTTQDGNYIYNGDFSENIEGVDNIAGMENSSYWQFLHLDQFGGDGTIVNDNGTAKIAISKAGNQTYSIQLIQRPVPLQEGKTYKVSFDAKASANRTIEVKMSSGGGENGSTWIDYAQKIFSLDTQMKNYSFTFTHNSDSYKNARIEFNLGLNTNTVWIDNVRVEEYQFDPNSIKEPLPSGNLIYNGSFDQGFDSKICWNLEKSNDVNASFTVSNDPYQKFANIKIEGANNSKESVKLVQKGFGLKKDGQYKLSFKGKANIQRNIDVVIKDNNNNIVYQSSNISLSTDWQNKSVTFNMPYSDSANCSLEFLVGGQPGNVYIDDVWLKEIVKSSSIKINAVSAVNNSNITIENDAVKFVDENSPKAEYSLNIPQNGDYVVSYKVYKISDDAYINLSVGEATYTTKLLNDSNKWYIATDIVALSSGTNNINVFGKNVLLDYIEISKNLITNGEVKNDLNAFGTYVGNGANAKFENEKGRIKLTINNIGTTFYSVQLSQNLVLEKGKRYRVSFDAKSSIDRPVQVMIDNSSNYTRYKDYTYTFGNQMKTYQFDFEMPTTRNDARFNFCIGSVDNTQNVPHTIYFDNFKLSEIDEVEGDYVYNTEEEFDQVVVTKLHHVGDVIFNDTFDNGNSNYEAWWGDQWNGIGSGTLSFENGKLSIHVDSVGNQSFTPQVYKQGIYLEQNTIYRLTFKASSDVNRKIKINIGKPLTSNPWFVEYMPPNVVDLTYEEKQYQIDFTVSQPTYDNIKLVFEVGKVDGTEQLPCNILLDDIKLEVIGPIIPDGTFDDIGSWKNWNGDVYSGVATMTIAAENGELHAKIDSIGGVSYSPQIYRKGIYLKQGVTYKVSFKARASSNWKINLNIGKELSESPWFIPYKPAKIYDITTQMTEFEEIFTVNQPTDGDLKIVFELGNINGQGTPPVDIYLDDVVIEEYHEIIQQPPQEENLGPIIPDGDFSQGIGAWNSWDNNKNAGSIVLDVQNEQLYAKIDSVGANSWEPQIFRTGLRLENGKTYIVKFSAKATKDWKINLNIGKGLDYAPWFIPYKQTTSYDITTEMKEYSEQFTVSEATDSNLKIVFEVGNIQGQGSTPAELYFDNISIEEVKN